MKLPSCKTHALCICSSMLTMLDRRIEVPEVEDLCVHTILSFCLVREMIAFPVTERTTFLISLLWPVHAAFREKRLLWRDGSKSTSNVVSNHSSLPSK